MVVAVDPYALFEEARKRGPNPFKQKPIVSEDEVWGEVTTDLPSLNEHVDQKIQEALSDVRNKYTSKIGILIQGDRGTGKSHVIHRIRKSIENEGQAIFSYIPPYSNASRINPHVRLYLALSLNGQDSHGVTQWQKLAAFAISTLRGTEYEEKYQSYLSKCSDPDELRKYVIATQPKEELVNFFDGLTEAISSCNGRLDPSFLKAALFLLLKTARLAQIGLAWIIGEEDFPGSSDACLPKFSSEQQEGRSIWMIQQICRFSEIASRPVLICFDQLDSAPTDNNSGDSPAVVIAKCIDQIYFQCSNVVLLCCAMQSMWNEIATSSAGGMADRVGQWKVITKPPTPDQLLDLVRLRLDWFLQQRNLNSNPYPDLFPFDADEVRKIASKKPSSRDFMKWCGEQFEAEQVVRKTRKDEFLETYNELLGRRTSIPMEDDDKLGSIIACAMKMLPSKGAANVAITNVHSFDSPSHGLHLVVSGHDSSQNKDVRIGIRVCQTKTPMTFNAVMKRLLDYETHQLTRGCLVRSSGVSQNWKVGNKLKAQLEKKQGGEIVIPKKDEIKPLVTLHKIYSEAGNKVDESLNGFTKAEVINLVQELELVANNSLVCEILSAPV